MAIDSAASKCEHMAIMDPASILEIEVEKLDETIHAHEGLMENLRKSPHERSEEMYHQLVTQHLRRYRDAKLNGQPIVGLNVAMMGKVPILDAMGLVAYESTPMASILAQSAEMRQEFLDGAGEIGLRTWLCEPFTLFGLGGIVRGFMLPPDVIVGNNIFCNAMSTGMEFWADALDIPYFRMDRPYTYSEDAVKYYAKQFQNLIAWLEEKTGHKMDWDKLEENVDSLRQFQELRREIAQLRKAVPHPMPSEQFEHLMAIAYQSAGLQEGVDYYRQVRDEVEKRVEEKRGYIDNERLRLLSLWLPPGHAGGTYQWWEQEWGAVSVAEPLFFYTPRELEIDPKRPLESLARVDFYGRRCTALGNPAGETIEDTVRAAREYAADGVVGYLPAYCQDVNMMANSLKDALKKQADVPMLVVGVSYVDPTFVMEDEIRDKTEPFFEMLLERKDD
ncbi:MAG: 2-hydroxyacyl-CoA dehydratase [Chloroflexi bacterium]|nr:2-hydroxyacyl-CoA dehydratase [Chloroflexota bacterium]